MFDINEFKKSVKIWIKNNPEASVSDITDFCEEIIPSQYYTSYSWLIDQTVDWYKHILSNRKSDQDLLRAE